MSPPQPAPPNIADLMAGIRARERAVIARAITLVESRRVDHQAVARRLVQELLPLTGKAVSESRPPSKRSARDSPAAGSALRCWRSTLHPRAAAVRFSGTKRA